MVAELHGCEVAVLFARLAYGRRLSDPSAMRLFHRTSQVAAVCLALVVGCATGVALDNIIVPARAAPGPSYEYTVIDVQANWGMTGGNAEKQNELLNRYGAEGWHVVGSLGAKLYLERELSGG